MPETTHRLTKLLMVLVAFLLAVTVFESYYLLQVRHRFGDVEASARTEESPSTTQSAGKPGDKTFQLAPTPQSSPLDDPLNGTLTPFNPNTWDPFKEMEAIHERMERMFDESFGRFHMSPRFGGLAQDLSFNPKTDISEDDKEYTVRMDVPGTEQSKIKAEVENRILTLSGIREEEVSHSGSGKNLVKERRLGEFRRSITLPGPVKGDQLQMKCDKGVVTITIPKDVSPQNRGSLPMQ